MVGILQRETPAFTEPQGKVWIYFSSESFRSPVSVVGKALGNTPGYQQPKDFDIDRHLYLLYDL